MAPTSIEAMAGHQQLINREEDAARYASAALSISTVVVIVLMSFLQYMLLSIRFFTSKLRPTTIESFCLVSAVWVLHYIFDEVLSTIIDGCIKLGLTEDMALLYGIVRRSTYNLQKEFAYGPGTLLIRQVATSWFIHLSLVYFSETIIPIILNLVSDHRAFVYQVRCRFLTRLNELAQFATDFKENGGMTLLFRRGWTGHHFKLMRRQFDFAKFERRYVVGYPKEDRSLAWNLTVSANAQEEIIDALQAIGQFGELGFHISNGRVYFEAMGVGSTLNLVIEMQDYTRVARDVDVDVDDHMKMA